MSTEVNTIHNDLSNGDDDQRNTSMGKGRKPERIWWALGLIGFLIGSVGVYIRFAHGLRMTDLGSFVPWGIWVATYEYFVWLEVGSLLVFTLLIYVFKWNSALPGMARTLYLSALAILAMALILIGLDLGHPFRAWYVLVYPQWGSLMTWMIWLHVIYMVVLLAKLAIEFKGKKGIFKKAGVWLSYFSLPLGVALVVIAGSVFGVVLARPIWQGSALPIYFLLSALLAGTGLLTFQFVWFWPGKREAIYIETAKRLGRLLFGLLIIGLVAATLGGIVILYPGVPAQASALQLTLFGPYWWVFWVIHIGLGVIVPIGLLISRNPSVHRIGIAAILLIVTFIAVPLNIVIPPQLAVEMVEPGLVTAYVGPGLSTDYFPSISEWLLTIFALAFGFLVFLFGYLVLWMRPQPDIAVKEGQNV
jgi:protein NrfD